MATLGDIVRQTADELFVDRERELAEIAGWLDDDRPDRPLLFNIFGVGGVGKTTLLRRIERVASENGFAFMRIDGRDFNPTLAGLLSSLGVRDVNMLADRMSVQRTLLSVDAFEHVDQLAPVLQRNVLPCLPESAKVIICGRRPLEAGDWRDWLPRIESLALAPLAPRHARELLAKRGVSDRKRQSAIVEAARGLPLALAIAADIRPTRALGKPRGRDRDWQDVLVTLVDHVLDEIDDPELRTVVEAASVVRRFDRDLLRALVGRSIADDALDALVKLSFVTPVAGGYTVHEEVRAIVGAALTARSAHQYDRYVETAAAEYERRAQSTHDPQTRERLLIDGLGLREHRPSFPSPVATAAFRVDRGQSTDLLAIERVLRNFKRRQSDLAATMSSDERDPAVIASLLTGGTTEFFVARGSAGEVHAYGFIMPITQQTVRLLPGDGDLRRLIDVWKTTGSGQIVATGREARAHFMSTIVFDSGPGEMAQHALGEFGLQQCLRGGQFLFLTRADRYRGLLGAAGARSLAHDDGYWLLDIDAYGAEEWIGALVAGRRPEPRLRGEVLESALRKALVHWGDDRVLAQSPLMKLVGTEQPKVADLRSLIRGAMSQTSSRSRSAAAVTAVAEAYLTREGSVEDAAERLHVSRATLFRLLKTGIAVIAQELEARSGASSGRAKLL